MMTKVKITMNYLQVFEELWLLINCVFPFVCFPVLNDLLKLVLHNWKVTRGKYYLQCHIIALSFKSFETEYHCKALMPTNSNRLVSIIHPVIKLKTASWRNMTNPSERAEWYSVTSHHFLINTNAQMHRIRRSRTVHLRRQAFNRGCRKTTETHNQNAFHQTRPDQTSITSSLSMKFWLEYPQKPSRIQQAPGKRWPNSVLATWSVPQGRAARWNFDCSHAAERARESNNEEVFNAHIPKNQTKAKKNVYPSHQRAFARVHACIFEYKYHDQGHRMRKVFKLNTHAYITTNWKCTKVQGFHL